MQTTNDTIRRFGFIILYECCLTDFLFKLPLIERLKKVTAIIFKKTRFNDYASFYKCF